MKPRAFLDQYYLHDSTIAEISYDPRTGELVWQMEFAFWMQDGYIEGTAENGMVNIHFHHVENYSGLTGKIDWFSVLDMAADSDHTVSCSILDDFNDQYYFWTFSVSDIELEDLHIDTTNG